MKYQIYVLIITGFIFLNAASASGLTPEDPKDFNAVISTLAKKLQESNTSDKPKRLAVVTFVPSQNRNENAKNEFGEYVTESLISALSSDKKIFKLFERKRLDAVLKENDLMLTDLMQKEAAIKVGELVPIDALFSGTYTKLKNYIDVNGRMIDVVTGEIIVSVSGRIKLTDDLLSLFPDGNSGAITDQENKKSELDLCKEKAKAVKSRLNDLSNEEKIAALVSEAARIPFDIECGVFHFDVMYAFKRYNIESAAYKKFLMATLDSIPYPANDERALEIIRYLAKDSVIDAQEWRLGLKTIRKVGNYRLSSYISYLLTRTDISERIDEIYGRIDEYFELAQAGKIGLPTQIPFNAAFFEMTEGVKVKDDNRLQVYCYEKYADRLIMDIKSAKSIYSLLTSIYKTENDPERKSKALKWLAEMFNRSESNERSAEQLYDFARSFEPNPYNKEANKQIMREFPQKDLEQLVSLCRTKFSEYASLTQYKSQLEDRINFCVKYDIPVPGTIPTMAEAQAVLEGDQWEEQLRVMKLLVQMRDRPKPIEKTLVKILDKRSLDHKDELSEMQESALVVLGNIRTNDPKAIDYMIASLESREYMIPDKAVDALVSIGKGAVPALVNKLNLLTIHDGGLQYQVSVILGRIGKDAVSAKPSLQALLAKTKNKDIKYAIEAALQAME